MIRPFLIILFMIIFTNFCHAFDLDMTVEDDIRKNYNTQEENLPALPAIIKNESSKTTPTNTKPAVKQTVTYKKQNVTINKGTSIEVASTQAISDWQQVGTTVKFKTQTPIHGKNYTIPASTVFTGEIVESHQPQITCNGGLVAIRIYSAQINGYTTPLNAYITKANGKKIFLNNIKGERNYLKTTWKKGNWGRTLFSKMLTLTVNLGGEGSTLILSPFPIAYGTICLGFNTITSPICAFFSKGGHVSIPAGSKFKIKLLEDLYI